MPDTHLLKPDLRRPYPVIDHGEGIYLVDTTGRQYLDGCSGAICSNLGHGNPAVLDAMRRQGERLAFSYRTQFTNAPAEALAQRLTDHAGHGMRWAFFVNSGSEATEAAFRLAIQFWQERGQPERQHVLSRKISYHGVTLGALSMSGHPGRRALYEPSLKPHALVPAAYCYRCPFSKTPDHCLRECADAWEDAILALGPDSVAAIIAEPIVGAAGGALVPPEGYFQKVHAICERYDILLIADEVMTGLGRTGSWFESLAQDMRPDMIVVGKGMSAGYTPMAGVLIHERVGAALLGGSGSGGFGHTYSGNPLSAAICLAVLDEVERQNLLQASQERGAQLFNGLKALQQRHSLIGDVRGKGLLLGLELVQDQASRTPFPDTSNVADQLVQCAFDQSLLIYPAGVAPRNQAVLIAPPLTVTAAEVEQLLARLDTALGRLTQKISVVKREVDDVVDA